MESIARMSRIFEFPSGLYKPVTLRGSDFTHRKCFVLPWDVCSAASLQSRSRAGRWPATLVLAVAALLWTGTARPGRNLLDGSGYWRNRLGNRGQLVHGCRGHRPGARGSPWHGGHCDLQHQYGQLRTDRLFERQQAALGLSFLGTNTAATMLEGGGANQTLTLGTGGITVNSGAGAVNIGSAASRQNVPITLGGNQTWANNSGNPLTIYGNISGGSTYYLYRSGGGTVALSGGTGNRV